MGRPEQHEALGPTDYGDDAEEEFGPPPEAFRRKEDRVVMETRIGQVFSTKEVVFEPFLESPYARSLSGEYDFLNLYPVSGLCAICNNEKHKEIDQDIVRLPLSRVAKKWRVAEDVLTFHLSRHMGPIYGKIALRYMKKLPPKVANEVLSSSVVREVDRLAYRTTFDVLYYPEKLPEPAEGEYGKLRMWTKERTLQEIAQREAEAIDFYDEMIDCKGRFERVYDEIMNNEFFKESKDGPIPAERNYASAVAAVKGKHGVLVDLAKMSIIAARISSQPGNGGLGLSAEMDSMVSSILGKDYKAALEADLARAVDDRVEADMKLAEVVEDGE